VSHLVKTLPFVVENVDNLVKDAELAEERFDFNYRRNFDTAQSSTWYYRYYNFTCLTAGSLYYYEFFRQIQKEIRKFAGHDDPLWYQCWFNWHQPDEVLDWHDHHGCVYHGYVSIRPHDTVTEFDDFSIKNEVGKLYIGEPHVQHRVQVVKPFSTPRLTVAFDVINEDEWRKAYTKNGKVDVNIGYIPVY